VLMEDIYAARLRKTRRSCLISASPRLSG
jgi:hypothetical protein